MENFYFEVSYPVKDFYLNKLTEILFTKEKAKTVRLLHKNSSIKIVSPRK